MQDHEEDDAVEQLGFDFDAPVEHVPMLRVLERDSLPLVMMRRSVGASAWQGPGDWFRLSYYVPGVTTKGPNNPCEATSFGWFPSRTAALDHARILNTIKGPRKPRVEATEMGLFLWNRSAGWALAAAGYAVEVWSNDLCVLLEAPSAAIVAGFSGYEAMAASWREDGVPSLDYLSHGTIDAMLRERGFDPLGSA